MSRLKSALIQTCILIGCALTHSMVDAGDPAIPGHHPLSQSQAGRLLMTELRCAACHSDVTHISIREKTAPDLSEVGSRLSIDFLQRYLASPLEEHPGTTMPDMLGSRSKSERQAIAEALTHFLVAHSKPAAPTKETGPLNHPLGKELFHSIGCVACHGPIETLTTSQLLPKRQDEEEDEDEEEDSDTPERVARKAIKPSAVPLRHVAAKYNVQSLSNFLYQPLRVRPSGRMPDMKLTPEESQAIAGYLVGEKEEPRSPFVPNTELVATGRKYFQELNCAACHAVDGIRPASPVSSLKAGVSSKAVELERGCLSSSDAHPPSGGSPRFDLSSDQIEAMVTAIQIETTGETDNDILATTLTAFRCIECHTRDGYGGVHDAHDPFFQGSQLNLGDDGRIPPPLTWMGAKLQPTWLKKVLFDGESVRKYMSTRMPQYGTNNLQLLPDLFRRMDVLEGPEMKVLSPEGRSDKEREQEKLVRAAGRELLGDKGANCVACHNFNGKAANVHQGIDLLTSYERLQPAWFYHYLQRPGAFRPRTVMPSAWPGGVATFKTILDGDTDSQIEAIWYYLSLGTSAADPSGVRGVNTKLTVGERAVVHRGRSRVAGFRGIAVGLPGGLSYAFNAETGTLSAIWQGEFVHVNWSGQGSGDFHPASDSIPLAQDVSFVALANETEPWPLLPTMTKEAPVNPNPLYPKNVGYQFRGYYLDDQLIPTFQYRSGVVDIEDRSIAIVVDGKQHLKRMLRFSAPTQQSLWLRAIVGSIQQESDHVFRTDRLRLTIPSTKTLLRTVSDEPKRSELLLQIQIPEGTSRMEFDYEPLKK